MKLTVCGLETRTVMEVGTTPDLDAADRLRWMSARSVMSGRRWAPLFASIGVAATLAGCGVGIDDTADLPSLSMTLSDFDVDVRDDSPITPGRYELEMFNAGPTVHELVVARTDAPASELPLARDGLTADEPALPTVAADEFIALDAVDVMTVDLERGHYVLYCNIEGHYSSGMYADLDVVEETAERS